MIYGNNQKSLINIRCNDMTLLAQILRLTYYIVSTFLDGINERRTFLIADYPHPVANSNRICTADSLQTEIAFYLAFHNFTIISLHSVPATCVFDY